VCARRRHGPLPAALGDGSDARTGPRGWRRRRERQWVGSNRKEETGEVVRGEASSVGDDGAGRSILGREARNGVRGLSPRTGSRRARRSFGGPARDERAGR
jgi:hypothetical protein